MGFASCKAFGHTRPASVPGLSVGLPPLDQARMLAVSHTKPLHDAVAQMADDLYGGYAPKQGCFGCLPKVLHDAKPTEQAISDTPFLYNQEVYRQSETSRFSTGGFLLHLYYSESVCNRAYKNYCRKYGTQIFYHEIEYLLSFESAVFRSHFFFNLLYAHNS